MKRKIVDRTSALASKDSTGVKLTRLLGHDMVHQYNPFLLLDVVDSENPEDYRGGFPLHPHRGIETITYMLAGECTYRDNSGLEGVIPQGGVQWITTGAGVQHEGHFVENDQMHYIQFWLNLPRKDKLTDPVYRTVGEDKLPIVSFRGGKIKVIAGSYGKHRGLKGHFVPLNFYHIFLRKGEKLTMKSNPEDLVMIYLFRSSMLLSDEEAKEGDLLLFGTGEEIELEAIQGNAQALYFSAPRLQEPVAWGGPIIMNTEVDLLRAFEELRTNEFAKSKPKVVKK